MNVREECRGKRGTSFGERTVQHVCFGLRMLRKRPGFTVAALLSLDLGIGAYGVSPAFLLFFIPMPPKMVGQGAGGAHSQVL